MKWIHCLVVLLMSIWGDVNGQFISPYQVSLVVSELSMSGSFEDMTLCSGAVIHERYILTTADCLHSRSANVRKPHLRLASSLNVKAGTFRRDRNDTRQVDEIFIHEKYNYTTLENDIALLKLNEPFVLSDNPSIQWIELQGSNARFENCFVSFLNETSNSYPFTPPQTTYVIDNWFCNRNLHSSNYTERENDLCSYYLLNERSMCKFQPRLFQSSSDRGAVLVCDNHLSGLLSQIIPPISTSNATTSCESSLKIWAFYTKVSDYTAWIHQIIAGNQQTLAPGIIVFTPPPYHSSPDVQSEQPSTTVSPAVTSGGVCVTKSFAFALLLSSLSLFLTCM